MSGESAPFPMLRAAWMRLIVQIWNDPTGKLLKDLIELSSSGPRGVLPYLEERFQFAFPFPQVKLAICNEHQPRWEPVGTRGWFGFPDGFEVAVPKKPREEADEAELLAEYMQAFPSMLGRGLGGAEAPDDFAAFGLITGRLITLAWTSESFRRSLFSADDARALVQDAMDVIIPWNFRLKLREYECAKLSPQDAGSHGFSFDVQRLPATLIRLNMPAMPDIKQRAIALAAYNDTGGQYPFTCG